MALSENKQMDRPVSYVDTTSIGKSLQNNEPRGKKKRPKRKRSSSENAQTLITRRNLIFGAAGVAALAAGTVGVANLANKEEVSEEISTLSVSEEDVFDLEACAEVDAADAFELIGSYDLPFGTLIWADDSTIAACLFPTEEPTPIVHMGILQLTSGAYFTLRETAVGAEEKFEIYDVRASEHGLIWMEAAVMEGLWRLYTATLGADLSLGEPQLVDEGDASTEVPTITIAGDYAFWQTMAPITNENARREPSALKRARISTGKAETIYNATGRMSAPPVPYGENIIFTPRHEDATSYCDLVCINGTNGKVIDRATLPSGMFPHQVAYGPTGFAFCFESIYDYGGGIANLGTYTPASIQKGSYENLSWFRFNRTPTAAPCWCTDTWFMVKSNQSVCAVNLENKVFCSLGVESGCLEWGDFLVSSGNHDTVVTATQIDQVDNEGEETKKTLVRVWQPLGSIPQKSKTTEDEGQEQNEASQNE